MTLIFSKFNFKVVSHLAKAGKVSDSSIIKQSFNPRTLFWTLKEHGSGYKLAEHLKPNIDVFLNIAGKASPKRC